MIITVNNILRSVRNTPNVMLLQEDPKFARSKRGHAQDMIGAPEPPSAANPQHSPDAEQATIRRFEVADLLQGGREIILVHGGSEYRLRITGNGKLILTK